MHPNVGKNVLNLCEVPFGNRSVIDLQFPASPNCFSVIFWETRSIITLILIMLKQIVPVSPKLFRYL